MPLNLLFMLKTVNLCMIIQMLPVVNVNTGLALNSLLLFRYCQLDLDVLIIEDLSFSTMNIFPYCFVHCCHRTFTNSYRRLRIMKGSEAIGLGVEVQIFGP